MPHPSRLSVAVCVPAYRQVVHIGAVYQMAAMVTWTSVNKYPLFLHFADSSHLDWARNMLLWSALKSGADWCLFSDADTSTTDMAALYRMLEDGNRQRAAVVSSPIKMRNRPGYNVVMEVGTERQRLATTEEIQGKIIPVDRIGTGLMAVSLGWLVKNWPPGGDPWFAVEHVGGTFTKPPERVGEDYHFCDGVRKRGGVILADGRFEPEHLHETSDVLALANVGIEMIQSPALMVANG